MNPAHFYIHICIHFHLTPSIECTCHHSTSCSFILSSYHNSKCTASPSTFNQHSHSHSHSHQHQRHLADYNNYYAQQPLSAPPNVTSFNTNGSIPSLPPPIPPPKADKFDAPLIQEENGNNKSSANSNGNNSDVKDNNNNNNNQNSEIIPTESSPSSNANGIIPWPQDHENRNKSVSPTGSGSTMQHQTQGNTNTNTNAIINTQHPQSNINMDNTHKPKVMQLTI